MPNILGKNLLIVIAHPDDESFLAGGTMHENHLRGGKNYLLCASLGELGHSYLAEALSTEELKKVRKKELLDVSSYLGVDKMKILDLPDGSISSHLEKLETEILKFVLESKPDYVISFGEDGYTGHEDHITLGEIAKKVAGINKIPFVQFAKPPEDVCASMDEYLVAKRKNGIYNDVCISAALSNLKVKIDPAVKLKALSLHQSQFTGLDPYKVFPKEIADEFVQNEYFYIAQS